MVNESLISPKRCLVKDLTREIIGLATLAEGYALAFALTSRQEYADKSRLYEQRRDGLMSFLGDVNSRYID